MVPKIRDPSLSLIIPTPAEVVSSVALATVALAPTFIDLVIEACSVTEPEKVSSADNEIVQNSYERTWVHVKSEI